MEGAKIFEKFVETGQYSIQYTEARFANFLSGRFTTMAVINPPES